MDAVTYPVDTVVTFIFESLIPLRLRHDQQPQASDFKIKWTPTLIVLDYDGHESHRTVGFLGPEELVASLQLGIGKAHFEAGRYADAIAAFDKLIEKQPKSSYAAEAIFFRGVSMYKHKNEPSWLKEAYLKLNAEFPDSDWVKKAYPYRLIG